MRADIEISFEILASISGRFWIDRDEWAAMTPDAQSARMQRVLDETNEHFDRNELALESGSIYVRTEDVIGAPGCCDPNDED